MKISNTPAARKALMEGAGLNQEDAQAALGQTVRFIGAHSHAGFALVVFQPSVIKGTNGVCQVPVGAVEAENPVERAGLLLPALEKAGIALVDLGDSYAAAGLIALAQETRSIAEMVLQREVAIEGLRAQAVCKGASPS